jgi:hypothetical protein
METASVPERSPLKVSLVAIAAVLLGLALVSWMKAPRPDPAAL